MRTIVINLVCFSWLFFLGNSCNSQSFSYSIDNYKLTLQQRSQGFDVKVTMSITYAIGNKEYKNDGFKFIGNAIVDSLVCSDESGIISSKIENLRETRISWQFIPVISKKKTVNATFIIRNLLKKNGSTYYLDIPWAGVFRVPIAKSFYEVIFTKDVKNIECKVPRGWRHSAINGRIYYYCEQSPLAEKTIKIYFEK